MEKFFFTPTFGEKPSSTPLPQADALTKETPFSTQETATTEQAKGSSTQETATTEQAKGSPSDASEAEATEYSPRKEGEWLVKGQSAPDAMLKILARHEKSSHKIAKARNLAPIKK